MSQTNSKPYSGLVLFNVAWNQGPTVGWSAPAVITLLILGVLLLVGFFVAERKISTPLVPPAGTLSSSLSMPLAQYSLNKKLSLGCLSLQRTWTTTQNLPKSGVTDYKIVFSGRTGFVLGCVALGWSSFGIWIFYFWQFLENLRGASPLEGTAQIAPAGISGLCAAVATGFLLSRLRPGYIMAFAMLAFCAGNILFATMPVSQMYVYLRSTVGHFVPLFATHRHLRVEMLTLRSPIATGSMLFFPSSSRLGAWT